ncbi:MAG TPA: ATP-binding protein, partial [Flavitalea sp.]|nr:ATP-binding protein [Flavitalea sp.]
EKEDGEYSMISIQDNGIGFDGKYVENIFSLFERLNAKDKYEGAGIGLAIAKKIIEKHNGMITAVSAEGRGAKFMIILPFRQS